MGIYLYEATDKTGNIYKDKIDAQNQREVVLFLERKKLVALNIEEEGKVKTGITMSLPLFERVTAIDKIALVRNIALILRSGLSIIEAIQILVIDSNKVAIRNILERADVNLQKGQQLSVTLGLYKKIFPQVFIGLVQAGEASGHLEMALEQLADQMAKDYDLTKKVKSALAYPIILLAASVMVVALLMVFVLPKMAKTFQMSGVQLPLITRIIVGLSTFITTHILGIVVLVVGLIVLLPIIRRSESGRKFLVSSAFKIPVIREFMKKIALVRFTRNLGMLIGSGINIIDALSLAGDTIGNELYRQHVIGSVQQIKKGIPLSETLREKPKLFPHLLISMITVGEKTGTLEFVLKTFANFYDEEVGRTLKDLTTFLEPLLLLFMGLVIGTIALSILLPIYQLVGKFT